MWLWRKITPSHVHVVIRPHLLALSCPYSGFPAKKSKMAPLQERRMIDRFRLWAKAGEGGNGCSSFRRSRGDRVGRPDGGNGGRGGDVILECSTSVWDFSSLQHHINAKRGGHGAPKGMIGSRGADKIVLVPVGTVLHLLEGDIPCSVEKKTCGPLDPWDIPGTLDLDPSEKLPTCKSKKLEVSGKCSASKTKETFKRPAHDSRFAVPQISPKNTSKPVTDPQYDFVSDDLGSTLKTKERPARASQFDFVVYANEPEAHREYDFVSDGEMYVSSDEEIQYDVAELTEAGQQIIVAMGGKGGLGNVSAAKLSKTTIKDNDEISDDEEGNNIGSPGSEVLLLLELKSIADVGFVGMPNAGKSTLLGAMSRAKPVVGHYAFTTLRPNLGNLNFDDLSITIADIPGLIKGAHENRGLGHDFLRHIERTKVLAYVVDLAAALDGRKGIPPWEQLHDLMLELECYREGLSERPSLVVANKIDEAGAEQVYKELRKRVRDNVPIFPVCAVLEEGVQEVKDGLKMLVNGQDSSRLTLDSIMLD